MNKYVCEAGFQEILLPSSGKVHDYVTHIPNTIYGLGKSEVCKFFLGSPCPHIFFKFAKHNHFRWPMMREVSLVTSLQ